MDKVWKQFSKIVNTTSQEAQTINPIEILKNVEVTKNILLTIGSSNKAVHTDDLEFILVDPTFEVVLNIEEIPPLDVFYIPKHKVVMTRKNKRKRTKQSHALIP